jgi:hypothetical protein
MFFPEASELADDTGLPDPFDGQQQVHIFPPAPPALKRKTVHFADQQTDKPLLRVLYVFAGQERKADVSEFLKKDSRVTALITEIDILRQGSAHDVLDPAIWASILQDLRDGKYDFLIITPPCNTMSRAFCANDFGPKPLRNHSHPRGFPWLSGSKKAKAEQGNKFVDMSLEAVAVAHSSGIQFLLEHPEDLGLTTKGMWPSSIWAWQAVQDTAAATGAFTAAFFQCSFGLDSPKPTRFMGTLVDLLDLPFQGWPQLSSHGNYEGPLPCFCGHVHKNSLIGRSAKGGFNTSASAAYPADMCQWIANMLISQVFRNQAPLEEGPKKACSLSPAKTEGLQAPPVFPPLPPPTPVDEDATSEEEEPGIKRPLLRNHPGGNGLPLTNNWGGKERSVHDGAGLCSPGRWAPDKRIGTKWKGAYDLTAKLKSLLCKHIPRPDTLCYMLACGRFQECPFPDELIAEALDAWAEAIKEEGEDNARILEIVPSQPFRLTALAKTLKLAGDPDWRSLVEAEFSFTKGVQIGTKEVPLPRVPAVFERKVKFRTYEDSIFEPWMDNYSSVRGIENTLREQFLEEEKEGMVFEITLEEAQRRWGSSLRIAAQGAILKKDNVSFRILHDGTHGVAVNPDIVPRDQVRMPAAGDMKAQMAWSAEEGGVNFALEADVSKAHRRFLIREADWGRQTCSLRKGWVWVNKVGTFGISSSGYHWSRLAGCIARFAWILSDWHHFLFQLIYSDDLRWTASGPNKFWDLLLFLFLWVMAGTPFSWSKTKGGVACEYVGYWLDYTRFEIGMSEVRAKWMADWLEETCAAKHVLVRSMREGLGRLGFAAGVLEWSRAFLAPMYSWTCAVPSGAYLQLPPFVRFALRWILEQLKTGKRMSSCRPASDLGVVFKADAKGEDDYVVLGGWECIDGTPTQEARWFSVRITATMAPWLFEKGHGSRTIAASELLASLFCILAFIPIDQARREGEMVLTGITDNKGNSFIVSKLLTTKWPVAPVLMETASQLAARNMWLKLRWQPREENTEADALTNDAFADFDQLKRIPMCFEEIMDSTIVLQRFLKTGSEFYKELARTKAAKPVVMQVDRQKKRKKKKVSTLKPW